MAEINAIQFEDFAALNPKQQRNRLQQALKRRVKLLTNELEARWELARCDHEIACLQAHLLIGMGAGATTTTGAGSRAPREQGSRERQTETAGVTAE